MVSPLVNSHPIFAVTLAALFLRDVETVTWRIALAAALVVAGVALIVKFGTAWSRFTQSCSSENCRLRDAARLLPTGERASAPERSSHE